MVFKFIAEAPSYSFYASFYIAYTGGGSHLGKCASTLVPGIYLKSFWIALWAGFLIEAISWIFALFESEKFFKRNSSRRDDDTIDIK